jgi:hypothetical protein
MLQFCLWQGYEWSSLGLSNKVVHRLDEGVVLCRSGLGTTQRLKGMLMSPLEVSFSLKRPKCEMSEAADECFKASSVVIKKIGSRDCVQEALAFNIYPTQIGWKLLKEAKCNEEGLIP